MCLAISINSLTGSRKIIDILNYFGQSVSYHTIEAIETDLASIILDRYEATLDGIHQMAGLATGLAWDNYDENTFSG